MVLDDALLQQLNEERMRNVMAPKVIGAWNLHTQTLGMPLDFFVLFSSFTSIIGNPGQGNYVAANAFLDALAHHRRAQGLPALTVNWAAVADVGYVAQNPEVGQKLEQFGVKPLPSQHMLKILGALLQRQAVQIGVGHLNWQRLAKFHSIGTSPVFSHPAGEAGLVVNGEGRAVSLISAILAVEPAERQQLLESHIREQLARVLGTSASKLDVERPLHDMRLDSLMAVEMRNRIQTELGVDVPAVKFMEGLSITGLATFIHTAITSDKGQGTSEDCSSLATRHSSLIRPEDAGHILAKLDQLADEEVNALLTTMLSQEESQS